MPEEALPTARFPLDGVAERIGEDEGRCGGIVGTADVVGGEGAGKAVGCGEGDGATAGHGHGSCAGDRVVIRDGRGGAVKEKLSVIRDGTGDRGAIGDQGGGAAADGGRPVGGVDDVCRLSLSGGGGDQRQDREEKGGFFHHGRRARWGVFGEKDLCN